MGWPSRSNRDAYGPTMEEEYPVVNPKRELSAATINLAWWQLAGLGRIAPKVLIKGEVAAGVVTNVYQGLSFDPQGALPSLPFVYEGRGVYSFAFDEEYPDENGVDRPLGLTGGLAIAVAGEPYTGTHDGGDNSPVLIDSGASFPAPDGLDGLYVYNLTDGCQGEITANTATQITANLEGGTDTDFDDGDVYYVFDVGTVGLVSLDNGFEGRLVFRQANNILVDPASFIFVAW